MNDQNRRREFLKMLGVGTGAAGAAAFTNINPNAPVQMPEQQGEVDWEAIDQHHEEKVQTFLDNIGQDDLFWNRRLEPEMDGDVKVFELTCSEIEWETEAGRVFPAFAYNEMIPGPEIRITEGDRVRMVVHNDMNQSTSIHWHGVMLPNDQDGVPYLTQQPIEPGGTYTYEFTPLNFGSHMYHSHHNAVEQVVRGLLGAFIIEPQDKSREPRVDKEYTMILNDTFLGFTINGKSFPYTQPLTAKVGERIRIRYMNEGLMIHPMHLHGFPQTVIAKDGYYLPAPYQCDTLNVAPGERYDVVVDCTIPGNWAFHCHILTHAESRDGLFGMVTPLLVSEE